MRSLPKLVPLGVSIALCLASNAHAASSDAVDLAKVDVTATKPSVKLDTAGTISVITREKIDRYLVKDIRDLVRYEPGVSVVGTAGRFGLDSFNIRGLSGNRTRIEIDGVSLPASFGANVAGGSFRGGRNQIDLDNIKQAEIVRGPASALYPSDGLGGIVSLTTKDPLDYLQPGQRFGGMVKEAYDSSDRSLATTATMAFGSPRNALLVQANYRHGHETENKGNVGGSGSTRTKAEPMTYEQHGVLAKYVHHADSGRRDHISVETSRTDTDTNVLTSVTSSAGYYLSQDESERSKLSLGQDFSLHGALADTLSWTDYWQKSNTYTNTQTENANYWRYYSSMPVQEKTFGGKLLATLDIGQAQTLSYGLSLSRTSAKSYVGGYGISKSSGERGSTSGYLPGDYPLHLFPSSDTDRYALFAQDRISLADAHLVITPGLRVEHYAYKPEQDALYYEQTGSTRKDYSSTGVTPKLGVEWAFSDGLSVYFNYARGFRPPLYNEIDGAWAERSSFYNIAYLPNPDLKEETSHNGEIGLRGNSDAGWFNLGAYYSYYDDFIWSGHQLDSADIPSWVTALAPNAFITMAYQSVNAKHAIIKGIEATGQLRLGYFSSALDGWHLNSSASIADGRLIEPGDTGYSPLNTVDPAKLVLGIGYDAERWGAELVGTGVRRHSQLDDPDYFRPPGYAKVDLFAHYRIGEHLTFDLGLTNLTDRKYWDWGNLQGGVLGNMVSGNGLNDGVSASSAVDLYTMPGRSVAASLRYTF